MEHRSAERGVALSGRMSAPPARRKMSISKENSPEERRKAGKSWEGPGRAREQRTTFTSVLETTVGEAAVADGGEALGLRPAVGPDEVDEGAVGQRVRVTADVGEGKVAGVLWRRSSGSQQEKRRRRGGRRGRTNLRSDVALAVVGRGGLVSAFCRRGMPPREEGLV